MTEPMDTYDFISQNGRGFFNTNAQRPPMMVRINVNVSILLSKNHLQGLHSECARRDITLPELLGEIVQDKLDED